MNQSNTQQRSASLLAALDSLLGATSAFKNLRAIALMALTLISAVLVGVVFSFLSRAVGSGLIGLLGGLVALAVVFYGANAVGMMMMQEAQGKEALGIVDAVLLSLLSAHRLIAVAFLEAVIVVLALLAIALVLFICKIPGLGPLLFAVAFPASAVLLGMLVFALFFVMLPLAGPAVWTGSRTFQVIARLNLLARSKLIAVLTQQLILFFIVMFVSWIIFSVVMIGVMMAAGLSVPIVGVSGGFGMHGLAGLMYGGMGGDGGYIAAGAIGTSLLIAVTSVIPALIVTKGICIIYLNLTDGMDFAQAEAELQSGMDAVRKKAEEARERARNTAGSAKPEAPAPAPTASAAPPVASAAPAFAAAAPVAPAASAAPVAAAPTACPKCHALVSADDVFCGECGHKMT